LVYSYLISVLIYLFFFSLSLCNQFLHSFPTRRSSDLIAYGIRQLGFIRVNFTGYPLGTVIIMGYYIKIFLLDAIVRLLPYLLHQDRKSTRLNSSHVSISYAVFCLKKKKKTSINTTTCN